MSFYRIQSVFLLQQKILFRRFVELTYMVMSNLEQIQLFGEKQIRTAWNDAEEKWYFSVIDIIAALVETDRPRKYWSDLKRKLLAEGSELSEKIGQLKMKSSDGKMYATDVADQEQLFRLVQSIPSPKVEPIKLWIARVSSERIDEMIDPELSIDRAIDIYRRKGYSEEWINQRLQGKKERKKLTDEWKRVGVKEKQYAILTNAIYEVWSGMTAKEYKHLKGLKKENLRDNMTDTESALTTLAEVATREISQNEDPETIAHSINIARRGGKSLARAQPDSFILSRPPDKAVGQWLPRQKAMGNHTAYTLISGRGEQTDRSNGRSPRDQWFRCCEGSGGCRLGHHRRRKMTNRGRGRCHYNYPGTSDAQQGTPRFLHSESCCCPKYKTHRGRHIQPW